MKLLLLFLIVSSFLFSKEDLCVCCIFQNDAKYLPEWIEFHEKQGVSHFYLYNNHSQDDYKSYLAPYIKEKRITLINWPISYNNEQEWTKVQCMAYMHAAVKARDRFKWCAFLDTDEFLFSPLGKITDILPNYKNFSGLCVNWVVYSTSFIDKIPDGECLTDWLIWRMELSSETNLHVKTIARLDMVKGCINPHNLLYHEGFAVDENYNEITYAFTKVNSVSKIRINHYWTRDRDFFINQKMPRYKTWRGIDLSLESAEEGNQVYDPILSSSYSR